MSNRKILPKPMILVACFFLVTGNQACSQGPQPRIVGEVIIVGNATITDATVRQYVNLYPGQILSDEDIRVTEQQLIESGLFMVDAEGNVKAKVTVVEGDPSSQFKDVIITVGEKPWGERIWRIVTPVLLCIFGTSAMLGTILLLMRRWPITEKP